MLDSVSHVTAHIALAFSTMMLLFSLFNFKVCGAFKTLTFSALFVANIGWHFYPDAEWVNIAYDVSVVMILYIFLNNGLKRKCSKGEC